MVFLDATAPLRGIRRHKNATHIKMAPVTRSQTAAAALPPVPQRQLLGQCVLQETRNRVLRSCCQPPGFACEGLFGDLVDKYLRAEALARQIIRFYKEDVARLAQVPTPNPNPRRKNRDDFTVPTLITAMKHFNLLRASSTSAAVDPRLSEAEINKTFAGGPGKRGNKSMKQLRNGYFHSLDPADKIEAEQSYQVWTDLLEAFNRMSIAVYRCNP